MTIAEEFEPLFKKYFYMADLFGGRGGMRSHHLTAHALYQLLYNKDFRGFFVREVHSSIFTSVWQDFKDRFEELQNETNIDYISISDNKKGSNSATNLITGASISTKGFKASSKNQTANLKSLAGATHIYIEECEEVDYLEFNKVILSLRKAGVQIQIIRAFNPPPKEHWIWKDYDLHPVTNQMLFEILRKVSNDSDEELKALVDANESQFLTATPKDDRFFISTNHYHSYDVMNERTLNEMERSKYIDFFTYCVSVLGLIASGNERSVYNSWTKISEEEFEQAEGMVLYALDFGIRVPNALVKIKFDGENRYYKELLYVPDSKEPILSALERLKINKSIVIIADSASENQIKEIRAAGYAIRSVSKSHDANIAAIKNIYNSQVFACGENIWNEYVGYKYAENKTGEILQDQTPKKENDHLMDAIKYGEIGKRHAY